MSHSSSRAATPTLRFLHNLVRWFAADHANLPVPARPEAIDASRIIPFVLMHLACLGVIWVGTSAVAVATAAFLYFARMFLITGFYHRYFSHKTFQISRAGQFIAAFLGLTCTQRGPLWWAWVHRHPPKHSDEEEA
ncbi:MAG: acyl-CoA desaturase, partial [Steroidobacteraceae bacterium]